VSEQQQGEYEQARLLALWVSEILQSIHHRIATIDWQQYALQVPVVVDGCNIGTLKRCWQEFKDGTLVKRIYNIQTKGQNVMRSKHEPTGKVAFYCRVATPEQAENRPERAAIYVRSATGDDNALAAQIDQCIAYCQEQGYAVDAEHIYKETSSLSGVADYNTYPALTALRKAAKEYQLDKAVVPDFSRFSRKAEYVVAIVNELEQNGVEVESITERSYTNPARITKDAFTLASEGLAPEQIANLFNLKDRGTEQE